MARNTNIKLRRSATAGAIPTTSNLDLGEIAINTYDGKLYAKTTEGSASEVIQVGSATDSYHKIRKSTEQSFTVTVDSKTSDHPHHGSGSTNAYFIDGLQSPHLHLVPGNTYRFDQSNSSNSSHPLRFYYEADKTTQYTTGVTTNGTPGSSGAYTQIVPTDSTPLVLHYGCSAHGYMGGRADFGTRNLTGFDTDDLSEGSSNLYFTNARADARIAAATTDDLSEGSSNLYFTNARVASYLLANTITSNNGIVADNDGNKIELTTDGSIEITRTAGSPFIDFKDSASEDHDQRIQVSSGNFNFTASGLSIGGNEFIDSSRNATLGNTTVGTLTTSGTATIGDGAGDALNAVGVIQLNGTEIVDNSRNLTNINNATVGGNLAVTGNLTVSGTTTTLNTATLDVEDKNITLNFGSGDTSSSANGAGITIQDAVDSSTDASILWNSTNDQFDFSHPITITNNDVSGDTLLLTTTEASSTASPVITFKRNSGSPADADYLGQLKFIGENDADQGVVYSKITGKILDASDGSEDGLIEFANVKAGTQTIVARLRSDSLQLLNDTNLVVRGLTYPTSDGSNGQALVTDGSGNLSFSSISAGGNAFGTIAVSGQSNVAADSNSDTLTLVAGSNITLTTDASADSVTIAAAGGTSLTVQDEGSALSTAGSTLNFVGAGVTASGTGATKTITIPGGGGEVFKTISVSGQSDVVADGSTDTLTLAAGSGMTLTTDASNDTITFASSGATEQSATYKEYLYVATSSQTTFSGSDANSDTLSYTPGFLEVYLNGVKLRPTTDFTASTGTSVVLAEAASTGDIVQIGTFVQVLGFGDSVVTTATGDGSTNTVTLGSNPLSETNTQVYIDGVYQAKDKYSVSGTTLTFGSGNTPPNGATIEVVIGSRSVTTASVDSFTADGGVKVDNITIDGTEIDLSSGDLTLDVAGGISLDADDEGTISFKDGGTRYGIVKKTSSDLEIQSMLSNGDILFKGSDDGSTITAFSLDMSASGAATFNDQITIGSGANIVNAGNMTIDVAGDLTLDADGGDITLSDGGTAFGQLRKSSSDFKIQSNISDGDITFVGSDGGSDITALTLDMSDAGTASFNHDIKLVDDGKLFAGTGSDLSVYHSGSHSYIENSTGDLVLLNSADDKDIVFQSDDGSGGTTTYFQLDGGNEANLFSKNVKLPDSVELRIGSSNDLKIYHDGNNSRIQETGTGSLLVRGSNLQLQDDEGYDYLTCTDGGNGGTVVLKHLGSAVLTTTASGVQTTGTVSVNGAYTLPTSDGTNGQVLKTNGSGTLSFADDSDATALLVVGRSANTSVTVTTGNLTVVGRSANVSVGVS